MLNISCFSELFLTKNIAVGKNATTDSSGRIECPHTFADLKMLEIKDIGEGKTAIIDGSGRIECPYTSNQLDIGECENVKDTKN